MYGHIYLNIGKQYGYAPFGFSKEIYYKL